MIMVVMMISVDASGSLIWSKRILLEVMQMKKKKTMLKLSLEINLFSFESLLIYSLLLYFFL